MEENLLRGRIIAMYRTITAFAKVIGWSNRKAYDIVNFRQEMTAKDIEDLCRVLKVEIQGDIRNLFFPHLSTNS